jgi:hypothetical protein
VCELHIKGNTETQIAATLQVSQPTVSRDLTELNREAQKHLYSIAKKWGWSQIYAST